MKFSIMHVIAPSLDKLANRDDAEVLKAIVDLLWSKLAKPQVNSKGLVGIDQKIADVESMIRKRKEPKDFCLVGICGMGGIGKTTLAEQIFYKLQSEYEGSYFLANEREESSKRGIVSLKNEIFSSLLGDVKINTERSMPNDIVRRIGRMKVLIVLDDVNDSDHLQALLGTLDNFGSGSRIIVTTRDEQVLNANKADEIYRLSKLSFNEALELFKLIAFRQSDHQREYDVLSEKMVHYAEGVPLVLKVLARRLCGKNKEIWKSELDKLEKMPPTEVYDVMKMSYDDLDRKEQQIFLDLACFVLRLHRKVNVGNLKSLLKDDESDNSSVVAVLERLKDKALVTFSEDNFICMHDMLQEMGLEIVRRQSCKRPASTSWLWDPNDICEALKTDKNLVNLKELDLNSSPMLKELPDLSKATNLEVLILWGCSQLTELHPSIFSLAKLKKLDVWNCQSLTTVVRYYYHLCGNRYLTHDDCKNLLEFSRMSKNTIADLRSFGNLHVTKSDLKMLPSWLNNLTQLLHLEVSHCTKLQTIPELPQLLKTLDVRNCNSLESLPELPVSLEKLAVEECTLLKTLSEFPPSLKTLAATYCKSLQTLPELPSSLQTLNVKYCKSLQTLPELPSSLQTLEVQYCELLQTLPKLPQFIRDLNLKHCKSLQTLPKLPLYLQTLNLQWCTSLQTLPKLPLTLETLVAQEDKSLTTILFPSTTVEQLKENRRWVVFWNCLNLDEHSLAAIGLNAQINVMKFANPHHFQNDYGYSSSHDHSYFHNHHLYQAVYVYPGSSFPEWLEHKTTKDYINIDLSSAPPSPLSFIFCFVLGKYQNGETVKKFEFNITESVGDRWGKKDSIEMSINRGGKKDSMLMLMDGWDKKDCSGCLIESDHLCVMYDQRCSAFLNRRAKNQTKLQIQVTIRVVTSNHTYPPPEQILKGFGVSPVSTSEYNRFIQQMELTRAWYYP
ncbi:TMV resistance protein N, partial [Mucuna pruriens]